MNTEKNMRNSLKLHSMFALDKDMKKRNKYMKDYQKLMKKIENLENKKMMENVYQKKLKKIVDTDIKVEIVTDEYYDQNSNERRYKLAIVGDLTEPEKQIIEAKNLIPKDIFKVIFLNSEKLKVLNSLNIQGSIESIRNEDLKKKQLIEEQNDIANKIENLINKKTIIRIRIIDPRVYTVYIYGVLDKEDENKIRESNIIVGNKNTRTIDIIFRTQFESCSIFDSGIEKCIRKDNEEYINNLLENHDYKF